MLYSGTGLTIYNSSGQKPIQVGTYSAIAKLAGNVNYDTDYSLPVNFSIIADSTAPPDENVYTGITFKPDTMEQGNAFSIGRMSFMRMNPKMSAKPPTENEMLEANRIYGGNGSNEQIFGKGGKNWVGASSYTENKRRIAIGKGSLYTVPKNMELNSLSELNDVNKAIGKARSGGSVASKKKGAVFTFSNN